MSLPNAFVDPAARSAGGAPARTVAGATAKLRLIAGCNFTTASTLRYAFDVLVRRLWPRRRRGTRKYHFRGGRAILLRENSTDWNVFAEIFLERVYDKHAAAIPRGSGPVVLIDLGANIGLSTIALAEILGSGRGVSEIAEAAGVSIVAVEPDAENFAMLNKNLRLAGLADRAAAVEAFAGAGRGFARLQDSGYGAWGMRMGPAADRGIPVLTVADIIARAALPDQGPAARVILKCDIEGSERQLFEHLRMWDHLVDFVILELHTEFLSAAEFHAHLEGSRYQWRMHGQIPPGAVLAVVGLERLGEKTEALRQTAG